MDTELGRSVFNTTHERFGSAGRWRIVVVLLLLIFHVTTFFPFVTTKQRLERIQNQRTNVTQLFSRVNNLHRILSDLSKSNTLIDDTIDSLLESKTRDFYELNEMVAQLKSDGPAGPASRNMVQAQVPRAQTALPELPAFSPM